MYSPFLWYFITFSEEKCCLINLNGLHWNTLEFFQYNKLNKRMKMILFTIGTFNVYTFSILLALSFVVSTFIVWKFAKEEFKEEEYLDAYLYTSIVSLIAARIIYILLHFDDFGINLLRYILVRETPGLSLLGGLCFGVIFLWWYTKLKKTGYFHILDIFSIAGGFALFLVKVGEQLGGAAFGKETNFFLAIQIAGLPGRRHPTELYESLIFLTTTIILMIIYHKQKRNKWPEGTTFYIFVFIFSVEVLLLEFLRNYNVYLYGLSLKQIGSIILLILIIKPIYKRFRTIFNQKKE